MALTTSKKATAKAFYQKALSICPNYNLKAIKAITAQAMTESNWGQSTLSAKYFNYFGMKCGSSWTGASVNMSTKEEYTAGTTTNIKANFRAYSSLDEGVKGYCQFITGMSRYKNLLGVTDNATYIKNIKNDGWATDSKYITTLTSVMNTLESNGVFDDAVSTTTTTSTTSTATSEYKVGTVYTTTVNLNVRANTNTSAKILKTYTKGTRFTCQEIGIVNGATWMRTPSGYICAKTAAGKSYIK